MPVPSVLESRPVATTPPIDGQVRTAHRRLASPSVLLFVILSAQLMVTLDATVVNVALPHIQSGLHLSSANLSWVLNAYVLAFGGLLLLGARAGDLLGRRRTFLFGIALFSLSSLAGGFAVTGSMLLAARALQGVGAALAAPSSLALLTTVFTEGPQRVRAIGLFTAVAATGGAVGLVAGGLLTQWFSWRWVMFVNVPIGVAVWTVGRLVLVETERRRGRFDIAGAVTSTLGITGVVFALVEAGTSSWMRPLPLGSFAAGSVLLGSFWLIEGRAEQPVLPLHLLRDPVRNTANLARGLVYAGMYGMFFFMSQFLQDIDGYSPLRTGASFLALPASVFLSSQLTSRVLTNRVGPKALMLSGISVSALSLLFATRLHMGATYPQVLLSLVLLGVGTGISLVSLTSASLNGVAPGDAGVASGLVNVAQQVGAALGLAVLVTIFGDATHHAQLAIAGKAAIATQTRTLLVHGIDIAFTAGTVFALLALTIVATVIGPAPQPMGAPATEMNIDA